MAKKILTLFTLLNLSVLCGAESKNLFNGKDLSFEGASLASIACSKISAVVRSPIIPMVPVAQN